MHRILFAQGRLCGSSFDLVSTLSQTMSHKVNKCFYWPCCLAGRGVDPGVGEDLAVGFKARLNSFHCWQEL